MAEPNTDPQNDPATGDGQNSEPQGTDWKAEARKWQKRAKENREKAKAWDEFEEKNKTELQKARDRAEKAEAEAKKLKADAERSQLKAKVSKETGVPAELIVGDDEESMTEFAKAVAKYAKPDAAPKAKQAGRFSNSGAGDKDAAKRDLARQLFGSND